MGLSFLTILFSNESLSDYPAMIASQYSAVEQIAPPGLFLNLRYPQANDVPLTLSRTLSAGRVFVKAPLQAYENLADDSRPFEELRSASPPLS